MSSCTASRDTADDEWRLHAATNGAVVVFRMLMTHRRHGESASQRFLLGLLFHKLQCSTVFSI